MWSDSTTVIRWLNSFDKKHQIFLPKRLGEILEKTQLVEWNYVFGIQKPASLRMLVLRAKEVATRVWANGPDWLQEKDELWPKATIDFNTVENTSELSEDANVMPSKTLEIQWENFNSWRKLVNTLAYILRWRNRNLINGSISLEVYKKVEPIIFRLVQKKTFYFGYEELTDEKQLSSKPHVARPFIFSRGIIRARGRLSQPILSMTQNVSFFFHRTIQQ